MPVSEPRPGKNRRRQNGKPEFEAVYDAYYDRIYKYVYTLLLNREDAEEVTSETFLAAYSCFDRYDPEKGCFAELVERQRLDTRQ